MKRAKESVLSKSTKITMIACVIFIALTMAILIFFVIFPITPSERAVAQISKDGLVYRDPDAPITTTTTAETTTSTSTTTVTTTKVTKTTKAVSTVFAWDENGQPIEDEYYEDEDIYEEEEETEADIYEEIPPTETVTTTAPIEYGDTPVITEPPVVQTEPPMTEPPVTEPPATEPPVTEPVTDNVDNVIFL